MKFTLEWLREHLKGEYTGDDVINALNTLGLEVEDVTSRGKGLENFTVAHILETQKHPDADRLKVCKVQIEDGKAPIQVVCGAPNARENLKVIFARPGALIPSTGKELKTGVIRGVESQGMLCSGAELLLDTESNGIMELPQNARVGEKIIDLLDLNDWTIDIAITPNRGDCLGVYGIARDLSAKGVGVLEPLPPTNVTPSFDFPCHVVLDTKDCPVFLGRVIKGVRNGPSPVWLKNRLEAVGQNSISLLVDLSNYFMLEFNRPCHFFDLDDIQGNLNVRSAREGEEFVALKGVHYTVPEGAVIIEDAQGLISLAGIKGGERGSVTESTTNIFIEIAHFLPDSIAHTGRALGLHSDARYRFERGVDAHAIHDLMERLTAFVIEHAGGEASKVKTFGTLPESPKPIEFDPALIQKLTGVLVENPFEILSRLGCDVHLPHVTPPSFRPDITLPQDLVEEVLRISGYDQIKTLSLPKTTQNTKGLEKMKFDHASYIRKGLAARGYFETVTFSFMHSKKAKYFGANDLILKNPISSELDMMRPSILGNLLDAVSSNQSRSLLRGAFFEIGPAYENTQQHQVICGLKYGLESEKEWLSPARMVDVYDIRADIDFITGGTAFSLIQGAPSWYHPGRSGTLMIKDKLLGYFGQVHPNILKAFDVKGTVVAFEIFQGMIKLSKSKTPFEKSQFQTVSRDFAFMVSKETPAGNLVGAIESLNLGKVTIFDVFEKEDEKSIALRVILDPKDHTFTEEELAAATAKIITTAQSKTGARLRQ